MCKVLDVLAEHQWPIQFHTGNQQNWNMVAKSNPLGLNSLTSAYTANYGVILAGSMVAAVPTLLLFMALSKQLIEGLTVGSVKG